MIWKSTVLALMLLLTGKQDMGPAQTGATAGGSAPATKPSYIQSCTNYILGSTASISCTFASAVTAGDQLYACGVNDQDFTFTLTGDSGTWTADPNLPANYGLSGYGGNAINCSYLASAGGGETSLTLTESTLAYVYLVITELRNGAFDTSDAGDNGASASPVVGNSITTSAANDLVLALGQVSGSAVETCTAGTNVAWTLPSTAVQEPSNGGCVGMEYYSMPTTGAISMQMQYANSGSSSEGWSSHIAAFKPQ